MLALAVAPYIAGMPGARAPHPRRVSPLPPFPAEAHVGTSCHHLAHIANLHLLHSLVVPLACVTIAAAAYLLGSIPFGYMLVRIFRKQDIRSMGSGNVGATNVMRIGAHGLGAATFVLDVLKGCTAVWLGVLIATALAPGMDFRNAEAIAALSAVLGHMFPVWLRFHGGKGVATGFGVFLVAAPWAALAALAVFAVAVATSRYVAVGSVVGAASFPIFALFLAGGSRPPFFIAAQFGVSLLIIAMHHSNIRRLIQGTEYKIGAKNQE